MSEPAVARRKFTVQEYELMVRAGILHEDDRVELVEGEVVQMSPISSNAGSVNRLLAALARLQAESRAVVSVQNPVRLGEFGQPQPDVAVLRPRADFYSTAHPGPEDVLLVVEVAETSAEYDRQVKVPLYGRWGIPEVWLVDLEGDRVEVYREPTGEGYGRKRSLFRGDVLRPLRAPDLEVPVDQVLG